MQTQADRVREKARRDRAIRVYLTSPLAITHVYYHRELCKPWEVKIKKIKEFVNNLLKSLINMLELRDYNRQFVQESRQWWGEPIGNWYVRPKYTQILRKLVQ